MARIRTNLLAYLDERLGAHSGRGPEFQFHCPFCTDRLGDESNKKKLGINLAKARGGCFRCGFGFRTFEQLFRRLNGGFVRIEEFALLRHEVDLPKTTVKSAVRGVLVPRATVTRLKPYELPEEFVALDKLTPLQRRSIRYRTPFAYLERRGVGEASLAKWQIGYCSHGTYTNRLIFPVIQNGAVVYWTNRYCGNHPLKSKNPPNVEGMYQRSNCVLNYDNCIGKETVVVVEGPFSGLAFEGIAGVEPAVLMGKFISEEQARLIAALVPFGLRELVLGLDPGAGVGSDRIRTLLLSSVPRVTLLPLVDGDPDDLKSTLPKLFEQRRVPSVLDRARQRLNG